MKAYGKLMAGLLALVVGAVGVGFCLTFALQIRQTSARLEREIPQTLEHIEQIAQSVRSQGEATTQVLATTQERVTYLGETIEQLSKKLTDREKTSSLLLVLDEDIDTQLDNARQFVLSMQNSMRNLGSTLLLFDSMSIFGANPFARTAESTGLRQENALRTVAQGLTQTADLLDQVTAAIAKLQSGESIPPIQLGRIQATLQQVNRELARIQLEVSLFSSEVQKTEAKFAKLRRDTPGGVRYAANMLSLFLFCFGVSQLTMAVYGLQLLTAVRRTLRTQNLVERLTDNSG